MTATDKNKPKPLSSRASDLGELLISGTSGFTVRKKVGVGVIIHFFLLGCMVILGASLLVYYKSIQGCLLAVGIGAVFTMVAYNLEKLKRVKQSIEFMNALFSSALGKGYQFCTIVKSTGEVVFFNRPFQSIFPAFINQPDRKIGALLSIYNVPAEDQESLTRMIASGIDGQVTTSFKEASAPSAVSMTFLLEAIDRPTGFFLLRGK